MTLEAKYSRGAWVSIAMVVLSTAIGRAQEPPVAETLPPSKWQHLTERLRNNLGQVESLATAQIFVAVVRADGSVQVCGLVAEESQQKEIEMKGLTALQREVKAGIITMPVAVDRVDASKMVALPQGRLTPLDHVLAFDKALASLPNCILRVQSYDPLRDIVRICGSVPSEEYHDVLKECLTASKSQFLFDDVVIVDHKMARGDYVWNIHDITRALANQSSQQVLAGSQQIIRFGNSSPEAWYYRAAGYLLAGNDERAIGAVRVAASMESERIYSYYRSKRFGALERFQGNLREKLERMVDAGPSICIVHQD
jgi:uncharacterized ubiquitin-like protein YukD